MASAASNEEPVPCANPGCTFWGRPSTENMCSTCFRQKQSERQREERAGQAAPSNTAAAASSGVEAPKSPKADVEMAEAGAAPPAAKTPATKPAAPAPAAAAAAPGAAPEAETPTAKAATPAPAAPPAAPAAAPAPTKAAAAKPATADVEVSPAGKISMEVEKSPDAKADGSAAAAACPPAEKKVKKKKKKKGGVKKQKNRKRCFLCRKKVGLTGIECRCKFVFCGACRYPDKHNCTFDYKTFDRQNLEKKNEGGGTFAKLERL